MKYIFLFFSILFLSGCIHLEQKSATPSQKKQIHITKLNKEVKKLDSHDKRLIYKSIKNEINHYNKKGDEDYKNGYYYDAIKAYELVNFYESSNTIPLQKINNMKAVAKRRAMLHYELAKHYINSDRKKALIELNSVMMNNPDYKDTKAFYYSIKEQRDIKIYINALQSSLETKLVNNKGSYAELKSIQKSLHDLAQYDYKNQSLQNARELLRNAKSIFLKNAIAIYKKGKLKKAKEKFYEILSLYPDDISAHQYIKKIEFKQSKKHNLFLAHQALQQNNYLQAIAYAKKVLQLESHNKEAKALIMSAKKKAKKAVKYYVKEGKRNYNNKNLDRAKECFEKALHIDKTNNTALIYHKKIQRQLQTIKSLQ